MHQPFASRADAYNPHSAGRHWTMLNQLRDGFSRRAALQTIQLAKAAFALECKSPCLQEFDQHHAQNKMWSRTCHGRQAAAPNPIAHGVPVQIERPRRFLNGVAVLAFDSSPVCPAITDHAPGLAISARMSSTRQAVMRGPSFTGLGYRPVFTPAHQVDLLTGIGPRGARMPDSLTKPVEISLLSMIERLRF